ncbi:MAG: hypothetical protein ACOC0R_04700 [Mariniphaga sp.]
MKAISVFCLFILLGAGAYCQHPPAHATTPHDAAHLGAMQQHENARSQALEAHRRAHHAAVEAHRLAHNAAVEHHRLTHHAAMEHHQETLKELTRKRLLSHVGDIGKAGLLAHWKARRVERLGARKSL